MSGRACKAAICCSAIAAKVAKIDELIKCGLIDDDETLDAIIAASERFEKQLEKLVDIIRDD